MTKIARKFPDGRVRGLTLNHKLLDLLKGFKNAVENHSTSVVLVIDGRSGLGKSTLSNQVGLYLDKNFGIDNIYYEPEEFLEGLAHAKPLSYICFDEAMLLSSRSAMSQINKMVVLAMSMIRSKQLYVCFCVNSIFDLDKNLAISRADVLLHVYGQTLIDRGNFCAFFKGRDGWDRLKDLYLNGKRYYNYNKPKSNFLGSFTKEFVVDEKIYEERKQVGVNKFLLGAKSEVTRATKQRNKLMRYLHFGLGWKVEKLMKFITISRTTTYVILDKRLYDKENVPNSQS